MEQGATANRSGALKDWQFWFGLISTIVALISLFLMFEERSARIESELGRIKAEERAVRVERELAAEKDKVKDNLLLFVQEYVKHVAEMRDAVSRYRETSRPEDLTQARSSARAMVAFIYKWREVLKALEPRLDGVITSLDRAVSAGDDAELAQLIEVLSRNMDSDLAALRSAINDLSVAGR